jgi:soluble cytochrome b562
VKPFDLTSWFVDLSDLSPPLRNASHSDSTSLAALNARIKKLEHAREASRERREKEMEMLRNQLKAAQESIGVLAKKNDALKAQVDMVSYSHGTQFLAECLVAPHTSHAKRRIRRVVSSRHTGRSLPQNEVLKGHFRDLR